MLDNSLNPLASVIPLTHVTHCKLGLACPANYLDWNFLQPSVNRVVLRFFPHGDGARKIQIINRVMNLTEAQTEETLDKLVSQFKNRHKKLEMTLLDHFRCVESLVEQRNISMSRKLLLGGYFTCEYSIEASALFNPSIVLFDDHSSRHSQKFVMSLRSTGEGHISSISFRSGYIDEKLGMHLEPASGYAQTPVVRHLLYTNAYELEFSSDCALDERVIFPVFPIEKNGMEDARFVKFSHENGETSYFGTYTAYDGQHIAPMLLETNDFLKYHVAPVLGPAASNKGMAFFPRKINGQYMNVGRIDGENLFLMRSNHPRYWENYSLLAVPEFPWELVQIGNCGSPIETDQGWILLTHGVGPMRTYYLSALLLDLDNPQKVIGKLTLPLLDNMDDERDGYVPNVVYTCGALEYRKHLMIPFGVADQKIGMASYSISDLLKAFKSV